MFIVQQQCHCLSKWAGEDGDEFEHPRTQAGAAVLCLPALEKGDQLSCRMMPREAQNVSLS